MPLYKKITLPGGLIGVWQLTETASSLFQYFSPEEYENPEFKKYKYEKRQVEWLVTRVLLKQLIGSNSTISYSKAGKPIITHNRYKHISISHSRYFLVVFVHEYGEVGIDIEDMTRNYNTIEKRYLSDVERIAVNKKPLLQCLYWCAKEAVFKLVPAEGVEFKNQIQITSFNPEAESQFPARYIDGKNYCDYQLHFLTFADHGMVWVSDEGSKQDHSSEKSIL